MLYNRKSVIYRISDDFENTYRLGYNFEFVNESIIITVIENKVLEITFNIRGVPRCGGLPQPVGPFM